MADTGTHSRLRGRIKRALNAMPGVMVTNGDASDGALDLILCVDGHYMELDVKTGDAMPNPAQRVREVKLLRHGGDATMVRSVAEAKVAVQGLRARR